MVHSSGWQTDLKQSDFLVYWLKYNWIFFWTNQTNAIPEFSLTMKFQQRNVIVQSLAVVIMMDVCCGHSKGLSTWAAIFTGQIVVANSNVNGVSGSYDAGMKKKNKYYIFLKNFWQPYFWKVFKLQTKQKRVKREFLGINFLVFQVFF